VVNDIDNNGELAGIGAVVDHDDTADFNDALEGRSALKKRTPKRERSHR